MLKNKKIIIHNPDNLSFEDLFSILETLLVFREHKEEFIENVMFNNKEYLVILEIEKGNIEIFIGYQKWKMKNF